MSNRRKPIRPNLTVMRFVDDVDTALEEIKAAPCPDCNADLVVKQY